jgi:hypothetical protein
MLSLLIIIAASLLAAAPLTASAQNSQWGGSWRNNDIVDDAVTSNNTNTNYQGIPDQTTALPNSGTKSTPTEGISNEAYDADQLKQWRGAIEKIPRNIISGSCEQFFNILKNRGAQTPNGIAAQPKSGGVTDYTTAKVYVSWQEINEARDLEVQPELGGEEEQYWATLTVTPELSVGDKHPFIHSYGLFWANPPQGCKAQYEKFLNEVAIHEAKHRQNFWSAIDEVAAGKYSISALAKTENEAITEVYRILREEWPANMQEVIKTVLQQKDAAYHQSPEGRKQYDWNCPCGGIVMNIAPEPTPTTPTEPPTQPPTIPAPTEPPTQPPTIPAPTEPPPEPSCPDGQIPDDGECIDPTDRTCPDGQVLVDGECQEPPPIEPPDEEPPDEEPPDEEPPDEEPPDEEPPEDGGGGDDGDNGDGGDDGDVSIEN